MVLLRRGTARADCASGELTRARAAFPANEVANRAALRWQPVQDAVAPAAGFLLQHLSLLFVPVGVGVMTHLALLSTYGLQLVAVIVLSTWIGMAVTAQVLRLLQPKENHGELR